MPRRLTSPQRASRDPEGWDDVAVDEDEDQQQGATWTPTPKQAEYLAAPEMEVLYGGAAGGGKTSALVIDALGLWQQAVLQPDYKAIIFRPTFPELRELENRMLEIYPLAYPGAQFNHTDHIWHFPSGAEIYTSYMQTEDDRYRWQSFEFQFVAFEELTQWATDVCYTYLFSRLRTSNPALRCLMRANCNPGGRGHKWVRERWGIKDDGSATLQRLIVTLADGTQRTMSRRFIPARLSDNPYLGADYEANLLLLDEMTRRALLSGRWDVIEIPGAIYKKEMEAAYFEGRITRVPYDPSLPVHTFWDLGMGDSTAIWFAQHVGVERRAIDYHEAAGEGLQYYARVLAEKRYVYGQHFAPHDIAVREMGTGKSRLEVAQSLGISFQIAPNLPLDEGIHACRVFLPTVYFDADKCARGIECLTNYRRKYNEKLGEFSIMPEHDWASHGSDSCRYWALSAQYVTNQLGGWGTKLNYPKLTAA